MESHLGNIDSVLCPFCGEGNEEGTRFCVHCGNPLTKERRIWPAIRYLLYGTMGIFLLVVMGFVLIGRGESGLAAKVNGEGITRKEFSRRLEQAKKLYESRYGQNLFQGEAGKENLNRLKTDILDEMTVERILLQGAKSAGYTSAPDEEIEKQIEDIKKSHGLSDADLQQKIGGTIEALKVELRNDWVISQFVEKTIIKGDQANGRVLFGQWLTKAKADAKIETYEKLEPVSTAKASCCSSGCGGGGRAQPLDPKIEQEARAKALEYYEKKTQKKGASARVTNFGCHIQLDIIEDGKATASLAYRNGEVEEI